MLRGVALRCIVLVVSSCVVVWCGVVSMLCRVQLCCVILYHAVTNKIEKNNMNFYVRHKNLLSKISRRQKTMEFKLWFCFALKHRSRQTFIHNNQYFFSTWLFAIGSFYTVSYQTVLATRNTKENKHSVGPRLDAA